jgi:hypothetical protein
VQVQHAVDTALLVGHQERCDAPSLQQVELARVHQVLDPHQLPAEAAAGMEHREVVDREAAPLRKRHADRIPHRERGGGRGGGRESERAGLGPHPDVDVHLGGLTQATSARISSVSPLFEIATSASPLTMRPRSPWIASAGCR